MYSGYDKTTDGIFFASESKAFINHTSDVSQFPPGSVWNSKDQQFTKWWAIDNVLSYDESTRTDYNQCITNETDALQTIKQTLTTAVEKRLMAERQIGTFLSGGLDSSLITALVNRLNPYVVNTYAIGMKGSTDLHYAEIVANYVKTKHTSVEFTADEGIEAVEEVIQMLETFDVTTVRASVGMHLLSKYISQNTDDIVIYSGEGADEVTQVKSACVSNNCRLCVVLCEGLFIFP